MVERPGAHGGPLIPLHKAPITNPDALGAMLALDAILLNVDRHSGNIILQPTADEAGLRAWEPWSRWFSAVGGSAIAEVR